MCFFNGHIRDLGIVPPAMLSELTRKIEANPDLWAVENASKPNDFSCFIATRHIVFQFPENPEDHTTSRYAPLWDAWRSTIEPIIQTVTPPYAFVNGRTTRIMLANLSAGSTIEPHVDVNRSADVPHKIHVPIQTHPDVQFFEAGTPYFLERGHAYEVNNKIMHGVRNGSSQERIHLIFDWYESGALTAPA